MKTLILWKRKRCRKARMVGTATATCSALTIMDFSMMALRGDGTLYVIDAQNVNDARAIVGIYDENKGSPERFKVPVSDTNGQIVAIGERAVQALSGAGQSIAQWGHRVATQGRVTASQSKALR